MLPFHTFCFESYVCIVLFSPPQIHVNTRLDFNLRSSVPLWVPTLSQASRGMLETQVGIR